MDNVVSGVNFASILVAGLGAGYGMAFCGYWMEGVFGLPKIDLRDLGGIYEGGTGANAWWTGVLANFAESVLIAVGFAALVYSRLPGPGWVRGVIFGALLWLAGFLVTVAGKLVHGKVFQRFTLTPSYIAGNLLQHLVFGVILGSMYSPQ